LHAAAVAQKRRITELQSQILKGARTLAFLSPAKLLLTPLHPGS
jgi:hypothetical protein